jgi:hypothetical protein
MAYVGLHGKIVSNPVSRPWVGRREEPEPTTEKEKERK